LAFTSSIDDDFAVSEVDFAASEDFSAVELDAAATTQEYN